jgi:MFS family permease
MSKEDRSDTPLDFVAPSTGPYASLKIRDFRNFMCARVCVTLAIQIQATIVGWQMYELTHDELSLGLIGLAEAIPAIGVSLYAGHIADTVERKKIILFAVSILVFCSFALLSFTLEPGKFFLSFGPAAIYSVIFLSGIARGFLSPANFSFMPQLVPRHLYANAVTLNSTFWEASSIGGPLIAGLIGFLFVKTGIMLSYLVDGLLMVAGLFFYLSISSKPLPPITQEQGIIQKIVAGLKFVFRHQIILSAISLDLFAVLFGGAVALLPFFAKDILHGGPGALGLLRAAPAIGAVSMAIFITHNPIKRHIGKILLSCVGGFGLCMIAFAISTNFYVSLFLLMMSGVFDSVSVIVRGMLIHTHTPENMKGRVSAVNSMFVGSSNEIGALESGVAAEYMGLVRSVVFGGCMTLLVVFVTGWKAKKLLALDKAH